MDNIRTSVSLGLLAFMLTWYTIASAQTNREKCDAALVQVDAELETLDRLMVPGASMFPIYAQDIRARRAMVKAWRVCR